jgi:hypothetical protein
MSAAFTEPPTVNSPLGSAADTRLAAEPKTRDGNWQFQCNVCSFWNLVAADGSVRATSRTQFDLTNLSTQLRLPTQVRREPPGGV